MDRNEILKYTDQARARRAEFYQKINGIVQEFLPQHAEKGQGFNEETTALMCGMYVALIQAAAEIMLLGAAPSKSFLPTDELAEWIKQLRTAGDQAMTRRLKDLVESKQN